jgi:hypothetical protein
MLIEIPPWGESEESLEVNESSNAAKKPKGNQSF